MSIREQFTLALRSRLDLKFSVNTMDVKSCPIKDYHSIKDRGGNFLCVGNEIIQLVSIVKQKEMLLLLVSWTIIRLSAGTCLNCNFSLKWQVSIYLSDLSQMNRVWVFYPIHSWTRQSRVFWMFWGLILGINSRYLQAWMLSLFVNIAFRGAKFLLTPARFYHSPHVRAFMRGAHWPTSWLLPSRELSLAEI